MRVGQDVLVGCKIRGECDGVMWAMRWGTPCW